MNTFLFDLIATQPSPEARFHGGGEYAKTVFIEASEIYNFDCMYDPSLELDEEVKMICIKKKIIIHEVTNHKKIEEIIIKNGYKIFYSALPYTYSNLNFGKCHFKMTIHGLRKIECPSDKTEMIYKEKLLSKLRLIIRNALFKNLKKKRSQREIGKLLAVKNKTIITVSEHSKHSILTIFSKICYEDVKVIYPPYNPLKKSQQKPANINLKGDYFLLVSANRPIKNCYRAIQALDSLFSDGKLQDKKVVIIGAKNMLKLQKVKNSNNFIFLDYLPEDQLSWFFENAFCFIYPSLNEGYGYPPLHAMRNAVPVLASAIASIPEVCSNAAIYFNPFSVQEIKNRIHQICNNPNIYSELQKNGLLRERKVFNDQQQQKKELMRIIFED